MKTIITILLLLSTFALTYGQKNVSKKIIGTWVGPIHEHYDSTKLKTVVYRDTIVFYKDHKYTWTSQKPKDGVWQLSAPVTPKDNYRLYLSGYNGLDAVFKTGKWAEQRHDFEIIKIVRKRLKIKTFISYDELSRIDWHEYEFTKI